MTEKLILHSYRRCPFAIRVRVVLREKGLPHEVVEEDLDNLSAEVLRAHPEGRVPLLRHGEVVLYQSTVITEYLEEAFPEAPLMPEDAAARARVRLLTYWCDQLFKPALDQYKYERPAPRAGDLAALEGRLHGFLTEWDGWLAGSEFLVGGRLSLADIHLFPFARQFFAIKPPLPGLERYAALAAWLTRMVARESFVRAMASQP